MSIVPRQKHIFNNIFHSFLLKLERLSPDYRGVDQVQPGKTAITNYTSTFEVSLFSDLRYKAVSTKVVPQKCKSVRDNADWHYG